MAWCHGVALIHKESVSSGMCLLSTAVVISLGMTQSSVSIHELQGRRFLLVNPEVLVEQESTVEYGLLYL